MGIFEKLKNALFEEEYVEVEEKPKQIKKSKPKEVKKELLIDDIKDKYRDEKPIAKKIVLPEKKETFTDDANLGDGTDSRDDDLTIDRDTNRREFRIMDDNDFTADEEPKYYPEVEPKIVKVIEKEEPSSYDSDNLYRSRIPNQPYGSMESPKATVSDYHTYDTRVEESTHFKPSPIISPIYGILDKNYKKEDVVSKREVRFTSSFAREKLNVDDVREKAFGVSSEVSSKSNDKKEVSKPTFEVETTTNLLVDLSSDEAKPAVKDVTMGDAVEYFEDLGLEYNVDYLDAGNKVSTRRVKDNYDEEVSNHVDEKAVDEKDDVVDADDNLFDLIDSMYQEQE